MVKEGEKLRNTSTGELYVVIFVKDNSVILEEVEGNRQILTGEGSLKKMGFQEVKDKE